MKQEATLWDFGGGIDPATAEMARGKETRVRRKFVDTGGSGSVLDLGVRLERDLVERLDPLLLETGTERHRLRLQFEAADWTDGLYLRAEPTAADEKFDHVVQNPDSYPRVGLPRTVRQQETLRGVDNPFSRAELDDHVVVRYLPAGVIEIYPESVYNDHPDWIELRVATPLVLWSGDESDPVDHIDLAQHTAYPGAVFDVAVVEAESFKAAWKEILGDRGTHQHPKSAEFHHVLTRGDVDLHTHDTVRIRWRTGQYGEVVSLQVLLEYTGPFRVTVPAYGQFSFNASPDGLSDGSSLYHRSGLTFDREELPHRTDLPGNMSSADDGRLSRVLSSLGMRTHPCDTTRANPVHIDRNWSAHYFDVPADGPPTIYIPRRTRN